MLLDQSLFEEQLAHAENPDLRAAYEAFAQAALPGASLGAGPDEEEGAEPQTLTARPTSKSFREAELRLEQGENWYYTAVLQPDWVLFYVRKSAMRDNLVEQRAFRRAFPEARFTPSKEIALRVRSGAEAAAVIDYLKAPH